ncbi:MAG: hypothetical protein LBH43_14535 [Treponema sp.]|nr:hypothetical protein [Treponema sp.]
MQIIQNAEAIQKALERLSLVGRYKHIMDMFRSESDITKSDVFMSEYKSFYRLRLGKDLSKKYFQFMQKNKTNSALTFEAVIRHFYKEFGSVEASFSAKLLHTIQPDKPTWDQWIGKNTKITIPPSMPGKDEQLKIAVKQYAKLIECFNEYRTSEEGKKLLRMFDKQYPNSGISDTKKVDLVLWQIREKF